MDILASRATPRKISRPHVLRAASGKSRTASISRASFPGHGAPSSQPTPPPTESSDVGGLFQGRRRDGHTNLRSQGEACGRVCGYRTYSRYDKAVLARSLDLRSTDRIISCPLRHTTGHRRSVDGSTVSHDKRTVCESQGDGQGWRDKSARSGASGDPGCG
jgi:hypothetical protein